MQAAVQPSWNMAEKKIYFVKQWQNWSINSDDVFLQLYL